MRSLGIPGARSRHAVIALLILGGAVTAPADELRRRGMMGVQLAPVTEENAADLKLEKPMGIAVLNTMPDTAASAAGVQAKDVIVSIGGKTFADMNEGMRLLREYYAGDTIKLGILRDGQPIEIALVPRERPREVSSEFETIYDCAGAPGHRVRTCITRLSGTGLFPAILFVQSLVPGSIEFADPRMARHPYKQLVDHLTRAGFVTMRVDRPGNGDSEGADPRRPRLADDVAAFTAAAGKLAGYDFVDPQRVFVLALSSGSALAPALAQSDAVRGVITYAAIARPWTDHLPESMSRRWELGMVPEEERKANVEKLRTIVRLCLVERKPPRDIVAAQPELAELVGQLVQSDEFIMGAHYSFFCELAALDLPAEWKKVSVPVLALWGESDFVAARACSQTLVEVVNQAHPGSARLQVLPGVDHNFAPMEDQEESFLAGFSSEFSPIVVETVKQWIQEQGSAKAG